MKIKIILRLTLLLSLIQFSALAQSEYIETFEDYFLIKAGITNRSLNLNLSPRLNGITQFNKRLWYRPAVQDVLNVGVRFKGLALSYGFKVAPHPLLESRQGESKYTDIKVVSFGRKLGYDVYYQDYKSYFISDLNIKNATNLVNSIFSGDQLQRRDDLRLQNFAANVYYVFNNDEFSYRTAFVLDERQVKSAGSFLLTGSLANTRISADSSFVIRNDSLGFRPEGYFKTADFYTIAVTPGYAYNLVSPKNFYLTLGVSALAGVMYYDGKNDEQISTTGVNYFLKGMAKASAGYHGEKWIVGASFAADVQGLNTKYVQFRTGVFDLSVFVAYRIKTSWMAGKKSLFEKKEKNNND